ncbi:Tfp pilus assembly protein PilE [uncultured Eubacterium sp.]|nr:Tfp pilus assembly protein PilE [uncultured Eubacterium sp.]
MKAGNMRNNRGFTLVELLVAVALVGILVSVSVVIFSGRTAEAKENVCKTNRDSMQHGTVVISMTERMNWLDEYATGGVNSKVSEEIISYLLTEGYIDDFKCPAGGTIYAADVREDLVTFKCTYHDDGMEPGEENANNQAAKDLADAVNKFVQDNYPNKVDSNTPTIQKFLTNEENLKYIVSGNLSGLLTDSVIDRIVEEMEKIKKEENLQFDKEKYKESLVKIKTVDMVLVPYFVPKAEDVVTYYMLKSDYNGKFGTTANCHGQAYVLCYKGIWYFCTKTNNNGTKVEPDWIPSGFNTIEDIQGHFDNLILEKKLIRI